MIKAENDGFQIIPAVVVQAYFLRTGNGLGGRIEACVDGIVRFKLPVIGSGFARKIARTRRERFSDGSGHGNIAPDGSLVGFNGFPDGRIALLGRGNRKGE